MSKKHIIETVCYAKLNTRLQFGLVHVYNKKMQMTRINKFYLLELHTHKKGTGFLVVLFCVHRAILFDTNSKM